MELKDIGVEVILCIDLLRAIRLNQNSFCEDAIIQLSLIICLGGKCIILIWVPANCGIMENKRVGFSPKYASKQFPVDVPYIRIEVLQNLNYGD